MLVDRGYSPDTIVARAGLPLRIVFRREDVDTCTERVVFSSPHIDRRLAITGETAIELPAQAPGQVRFTCGMGRYHGRINLVAVGKPSLLQRLRARASRLESPLGTALVLWIFSLPFVAVGGALAADVTLALAVAGAGLLAWVAGCLWAFGRQGERT